jgi:hypothetical protein
VLLQIEQRHLQKDIAQQEDLGQHTCYDIHQVRHRHASIIHSRANGQKQLIVNLRQRTLDLLQFKAFIPSSVSVLDPRAFLVSDDADELIGYPSPLMDFAADL